MDEILYMILQCDEPLIDQLKEELSSQYYSFDDAAAEEEDPYGDEVRYELDEPNDIEFRDTWSTFEKEIRERARFFNSTAEAALHEIFWDLSRFQTRTKTLFREAGPGTATRFLYRARYASDTRELARFVERPARELGAPPSRLTVSGRMNPQWISMFYGALDADTCIAEIRSPVGGYAVIGTFTIVRKLRLLDLATLKQMFVKEASFFDPAFSRLRAKAHFLQHLVNIMSSPVLPTDQDYHYLPTQAVAEYLSEKVEPRIDGLIFPSSQRGESGENVVLFRHASRVESDTNEELDMKTEFGGWDRDDLDIVVWVKKERKSCEEPRNQLPEQDETISDFSQDGSGECDIVDSTTEEPTLRVDLETIEVRCVKGVEYRTDTRHVHRYSI